MRGKQYFTVFYMRILRITPADAGKTNNYCLQGLINQDHPRGCGENFVNRKILYVM